MSAPIYIHIAVIDDDEPPKISSDDDEPPKISSDDDEPPKTSYNRTIPCGKNQLFVEDADADADEQIKLRYLDLPDLRRYEFINSSFAIAKSRLFFVGGCLKNQSEGAQHNGIMSLNFLQQKKRKKDEDDSPSPSPSPSLSWESVRVRDEISFAQGTGVSEDSNLIYAIGMEGELCAFYSETMTIKFNIPNAVRVPPGYRPHLLALDDNKIYVNCVNYLRRCLLGFYDLINNTWHIIDTKPRLDCLLSHKTVVVRNSYLISFAMFHPVTNQSGPALYVYDIWGKKWLDEKVHGLKNDDIVLPSSEAYFLKTASIFDPYLIQIPKEELKFALFWERMNRDYTSDFYLTKFSLNIQEQQNGASPTFHADHFSYAPPFSIPGEFLIVKIAA